METLGQKLLLSCGVPIRDQLINNLPLTFFSVPKPGALSEGLFSALLFIGVPTNRKECIDVYTNYPVCLGPCQEPQEH
eukprot:scaffold5357_cov71-Attheya_sp.AAC.1